MTFLSMEMATRSMFLWSIDQDTSCWKVLNYTVSTDRFSLCLSSHLSGSLWSLTQVPMDRNCQKFFPAATASHFASSASHVRWRRWRRWSRPRRTEPLPPEGRKTNGAATICRQDYRRRLQRCWANNHLDVFPSASNHEGQFHLPVHLLQDHEAHVRSGSGSSWSWITSWCQHHWNRSSTLHDNVYGIKSSKNNRNVQDKTTAL